MISSEELDAIREWANAPHKLPLARSLALVIQELLEHIDGIEVTFRAFEARVERSAAERKRRGRGRYQMKREKENA